MKKTNLTHFSTKSIAKMVNDNELRVDNPVQRAFVWTIPQRSDFIDSILGGWMIPAIHVEKTNAGGVKSRDIYDVLDGQQRCLTIATYYYDEWALEGVKPIEIDGEIYDIDGKLFSELPEKLQEIYTDYMLPVFWVDQMSQEEKTIAFRKLNAGKALSTNDMNVAYCGDLETVNGFGKHEVFNKLLTAVGKKNKRHVSYIMKIYAMLHEDVTEITFESKDFRPYCKNTKFTDDDKQQMTQVLDYINGLLKYGSELKEKSDKEAYKKVKKEVHLISLIPFVKDAINKGYSEMQFWNFCALFFNTCSRTYTKASQSDTSKNTNIVNRDTELTNAWDAYVANHRPPIAPEFPEPIVKETELDYAKRLINQYTQEEFDKDTDFSDLTDISLAWTRLEDYEHISIEVIADLENFCIKKYLNDKLSGSKDELVETRQYNSLKELIDKELVYIDFQELISIDEDVLQEHGVVWR